MSSSAEMKKDFIERIEAHPGILYKICRLYSNDQEDFQDLRQEILYQLWKSFPHYKGTSAFSTWMYRIALNTALMKLRSADKKNIMMSYNDDSPILLGESVHTQIEEVELLYLCIKELNQIERAIILLKLEGYNYQEISDLSGISPGNVSVRLVRIKDRLKESLKKKGYKGE